MGTVVPRGETSETPDPVLERGQPDLVVIPRRDGYVKSASGCATSMVNLVLDRFVGPKWLTGFIPKHYLRLIQSRGYMGNFS